jgi:hypothetical protein
MSERHYPSPIPGSQEDWGDVSTHIVRNRDAMITFVRWTQELAGTHVPFETACDVMNRVMDKPKIELR